MSFFNRRRGEGGTSPVPNEQLNLTNYDERTVFPTDGFSVQPSAPQPMQQPIPSATTTAVFDGAGVSSVPPIGTERPMVFASREHKDVYIYEYSDRLEYYVKMNTSMYKFNTVYKNSQG
ncbi:MAG: hypothetical protein HDT28_09660 [Clostridiales bacterium]|nr:hypothetical protein [Clostridiales bacterium]